MADSVSVDTSALEDLARNTSLPVLMRLHYLAMARVGSDGQASFLEKELSTFLGVSRQAVNQNINKGIVAGMFLEDSDCLSILLPGFVRPSQTPLQPSQKPSEAPKTCVDPWGDPEPVRAPRPSERFAIR